MANVLSLQAPRTHVALFVTPTLHTSESMKPRDVD